MGRPHVLILLLTLAGFTLRLYYLTTSHPFFDEYTTVLAARQILDRGWPLLPSGLFYEHGLLATYLIAPFTALFIHTPLAEWQAAQWGLMPARWPSLWISTVTIPLLFACGRRWLGANPALLAAGLFAFSPEGVVWGGRARMYALATFLVLLLVYWAYRGVVSPAPARYRWLALGGLLLALLTQFGVMMLVPPLMAGMILAGWRSNPKRPWFWRKTVLLEAVALGLALGLAILVKRLGQPLGAAPLGSAEAGEPLAALVETLAYQTTFYFTWDETLKFLARQFGVAHHLWLTLAALLAVAVGLIYRRTLHSLGEGGPHSTVGGDTPPPSLLRLPNFLLFLGLIFGLILLEMVTLLEPFRRNPRYVMMYLPLFYLLAAGLLYGALYPLTGSRAWLRSPLVALALLALFVGVGYGDLRVALRTPEPAYEEAFAYIYREWQPGDRLLTMNSPAAGLYLNRVDGFTVQNEAEQFLLQAPEGAVDRWWGAPWIGTGAELTAALNEEGRSWFVSDTIRQPVYFRGDWQAVVDSQMEQVWAGDNALVYRTRPERRPLPTQAEVPVEARLGSAVQLAGYTLAEPAATGGEALALTLFWQALAPLPADYTVFLHLRNAEGETVAQRDGQPLDGAYPTSRWQPGETVIDPITLPLPADLPPGQYRLFIGLYRLDTLERLPVVDDRSGENAILLGEVALW